MDVFVFVILIVAISVGSWVYTEKLKADAKIAKASADSDLAGKLSDVEERLQTLERIVTDQKTQLKEKIDSL